MKRYYNALPPFRELATENQHKMTRKIGLIDGRLQKSLAAVGAF
jgi:hypothetical protein